jgi:hypothetical protein
MSRTTMIAPATLTEAVIAAVGEGAWSPADVVATVADQHADRHDVMATLWDLVDAGVLTYHPDIASPAFRLARP